MTSAFLKRATLVLATVLYASTGFVASAQSDVKVRQRMGPGAETVLYIKGPRMRSEMGGNVGMTTIVQCDLKRTLTIYEKTKSYLVTATDSTGAPIASGDGDGGGTNPSVAAPATPQRGGVVNVTQTITDTGERKQMFGFTARRIKTSLVKTASPDACDKDLKVETDGWYIDFQYAFECPSQTPKPQSMPMRPQPPGCKDEVRTKTIGSAKLGFPLLVTTTLYQPDGKTTSSTHEVLELSREPLNAALFEAPEGYTLAKNMQELYGMGAMSAAGSNSRPGSSSTSSPNATTSSANTSTSATGPKKAGVIRIGLLLPKVQMNSGDTAQAAEALRTNLAGYLKTPTVEVIPLSAAGEARQSECDYVLHVSMSVKKGGGGSMFGRAIGNIAGSAVGHIPGGGSGGTGAARSGAIAGSIKAKDEVTLEYKLEPTNAATKGLANSAKAKASRDGEDVLTGLMQRAAGDIVAAVSQKQ